MIIDVNDIVKQFSKILDERGFSLSPFNKPCISIEKRGNDYSINFSINTWAKEANREPDANEGRSDHYGINSGGLGHAI